MKRLFTALTALALGFAALQASAAAPAADLKNIVPSSSGIVVGLDMAALLDLPFVKEARAKSPELDKQFKELESKLAARKLSIQSALSYLLVFADKDGKAQTGGVLIRTAMTDKNVEALLKGEIFATPSSTYKVETVQGHKTYVLSNAKASSIIPGQEALAGGIPGGQLDKLMDAGEGKTLALCEMGGGVYVIVDRADLDKYLSAPKGLSQTCVARLLHVDTASPVWGVFELPERPQANNPAPNAFAERLTGFAFSITPKPNGDLFAKAGIECLDPAAAAATCSQIQGLVFMMGLGAGASADPQAQKKTPLQEILETLVLNNSGKFISAQLTVSKKNLESLREEAQGMGQPALGVPQSAPAPQPKTAKTSKSSSKPLAK